MQFDGVKRLSAMKREVLGYSSRDGFRFEFKTDMHLECETTKKKVIRLFRQETNSLNPGSATVLISLAVRVGGSVVLSRQQSQFVTRCQMKQ